MENKVHWNTENPKPHAYRPTKIYEMSENSTDQINPKKIYASMACTYYNSEIPRRKFKDSSQLTNWILDSGVTCHMTPETYDFIPGSLVETDKYIKVSYGHLVTGKKTR